MVSINNQTKEINCKIVYYGPGLGGKTTNLLIIHKKVPTTNKSEMVSLATESDRTLFFDYLPLDLGKIKGFETKFQLYTVPGQVYYNETRKLVLRGVDGIVFVGDSQRSKLKETIESFENLEYNLKESGLVLEDIPHVIQYNKRDMPDLVSLEELDEKVNKYAVPSFEGVAFKGTGVFDTLKSISKMVINKYNATASFGATTSKFKKKSPSGEQKSEKPLSPPVDKKPAAKVEEIDEDIQNYIKRKKKTVPDKKVPVDLTPIHEEPEPSNFVSPNPEPPKTEMKKPPLEEVEPAVSQAFIEPDVDDNFEYTPDSPGHTGVSEDLTEENSPFLDIKPYTGMTEGDLPTPDNPSTDLDFDPYGDGTEKS